jgi:hypothetical protein
MYIAYPLFIPCAVQTPTTNPNFAPSQPLPPLPISVTHVGQFIPFVPTAVPLSLPNPALPPHRAYRKTKPRQRIVPRRFTPAEDNLLKELLKGRDLTRGAMEWEVIASRMGSGLTPRQIMDRWFSFLRPGVSTKKFSVEERRQVLKESVMMFGKWCEIAKRIGDGKTRTAAQVNGVALGMYQKLHKLQIRLKHPDEVDALPDSFFRNTKSKADYDEIRERFERAMMQKKETVN